VYLGFGGPFYDPFWPYYYPDYGPYPYPDAYSAPYPDAYPDAYPPTAYPNESPPDRGASSAAPAATWYYCDNPQGYYPYVRSCNQPWQSVPASPPSG
jgi:hypothetical protein